MRARAAGHIEHHTMLRQTNFPGPSRRWRHARAVHCAGELAREFSLLLVGLEHFAAAIAPRRISHHGLLKAFDRPCGIIINREVEFASKKSGAGLNEVIFASGSQRVFATTKAAGDLNPAPEVPTPVATTLPPRQFQR